MKKATHLASVLPITLLSLAVGAAPALASDLLVDVNDPDADLPGDNLYAQIQEAVDAASSGDMIRVQPGTYNGFVVTTDGLTIVGANASSKPVVTASGFFTRAVDIQANDVTMWGLEVSISGTFSSGFRVSGNYNNARLTNNTVYASGNIFGIEAFSPNYTLSQNSVNGGLIGIYVGDTGGTLISNEAVGSVYGYNMINLDGAFMAGNLASANGRGFRLRNVTNCTFSGNTSENNGGNGFELIDDTGGGNIAPCTGNTFHGTKVSDNGGWGVLVQPLSVNNSFAGTSGSGNVLGSSNVPLPN